MKISNGIYGINSKDIISQIKIEKDEFIKGRIVKYKKESGEAVLKLLNGEEIHAKIQGKLDKLPDNIVKLKVLDISDNKIKLKIEEDKEIDSGTISIKDKDERLIKILNHNFPLTKENIELIDSLESISNSLKNVQDLDGFIKDLLTAKGVDLKSPTGIKIFNQLKAFASEFKDLSLDDILNLIENDIDLTSDNIKSYNRILKEPSAILKDIQILGKYLGAREENRILNAELKDEIKEAIANVYDKAKSVMKAAEIMDRDNISGTINIFSKNLNDFKVYNSISNNYYYIDVPLKYKENEYQFKLIIKDDRKRGKVIDKDDVSLAASVKTTNMGTVDIFLKIKSGSMNVTLNAEKSFISVIKSSSQTLEKNLNKMNYNVIINVEEKKRDLDLSSYNDFFSDKDFYSLNIYV
ncbi:MAG: hypothetical protein LIR50_19500 [Bacillota bacterium]|nr:hypothetical protein [Bacillota bacterium]